ncbi:MAG: DnaJ domain-containing protein [Christensenellales bacterium]|jgi:molecular chaperone DnaJ
MSLSEAYKILGLREGASEDEIRRAYRDLVKKYHPDQYVNNPLSDLAAEKLKEINEAYDVLTRRDNRSQYSSQSSSGTGSASHSGSSSGYSGDYASEFYRVRQYLSANNLNAAEAVLRSIPLQNAEWFYLNGIIKMRRGAYDAARDSLGRAASMDPSNVEYRNAYEALVRSYQSYGMQRRGGMDMCQVCQTLWCLDCCCEMMGGDFIRCC